MSFVFHCPKCQQKFCYDDSFNGQEMTCISCGERFVIEGTEDAEETSAVPASGSEEVEKYIAKFRKEHHFSVPHSGEKAFDKNKNETHWAYFDEFISFFYVTFKLRKVGVL